MGMLIMMAIVFIYIDVKCKSMQWTTTGFASGAGDRVEESTNWTVYLCEIYVISISLWYILRPHFLHNIFLLLIFPFLDPLHNSTLRIAITFKPPKTNILLLMFFLNIIFHMYFHLYRSPIFSIILFTNPQALTIFIKYFKCTLSWYDHVYILSNVVRK